MAFSLLYFNTGFFLMSMQQLHDQLIKLKAEINDLSVEEVERKQRLTEIIESLEVQILENKGIHIDTEVNEQLQYKLRYFEVEHPNIASILANIINILKDIGI